MANAKAKKSRAASTPKTPETPTHQEIKILAYQIYLDRGATDGQDVDDWLEAERRLVGLTRELAGRSKAQKA
jgi:hypothetical protein